MKRDQSLKPRLSDCAFTRRFHIASKVISEAPLNLNEDAGSQCYRQTFAILCLLSSRMSETSLLSVQHPF